MQCNSMTQYARIHAHSVTVKDTLVGKQSNTVQGKIQSGSKHAPRQKRFIPYLVK